MKKFLFGLLGLLVFIFSPSVGLAADGAEIKKEATQVVSDAVDVHDINVVNMDFEFVALARYEPPLKWEKTIFNYHYESTSEGYKIKPAKKWVWH